MKWSFLLSFLFLPVSLLFSQAETETEINYARQIIDTLTSKYFAGRGYTHKGMEKAADFLEKEFEEIGLKQIDGSYTQEFSMPINIIEDSKLVLDGKELEYGKDFIVKPSSKSQNFLYKELYFFSPEKFEKALESRKEMIAFIEEDMKAQTDKHLIMPPVHFETDSINRYYKSWPQVYTFEENRNRAVFYFTTDRLISSLSQEQDSLSQFTIDDSFFHPDLQLNDYFIKSRFESDFRAKNILGKIDGLKSDSLILITAHYDHLGQIGDAYFPGASDNASGVAFILELAKYFSNHPPDYTLVFIAFAAEEAGLLGSAWFVEHPLIDLAKIKFLLNFDIMGAGEEGIQIVNSSIFTEEYDLLQNINSQNRYTPQIKTRGEACNSDHCPFYLAGVPSFFIYTLGGPGHYHDIFDTAESLPLAGFEDLQQLFREFIDRL